MVVGDVLGRLSGRCGFLAFELVLAIPANRLMLLVPTLRTAEEGVPGGFQSHGRLTPVLNNRVQFALAPRLHRAFRWVT